MAYYLQNLLAHSGALTTMTNILYYGQRIIHRIHCNISTITNTFFGHAASTSADNAASASLPPVITDLYIIYENGAFLCSPVQFFLSRLRKGYF